MQGTAPGEPGYAGRTWAEKHMCPSIKTLRRPERPASDDEIRAAALQFVRKVSGYRQPSRANTATFERAVDEVSAACRALLDDLAPAKRVSRPLRSA